MNPYAVKIYTLVLMAALMTPTFFAPLQAAPVDETPQKSTEPQKMNAPDFDEAATLKRIASIKEHAVQERSEQIHELVEAIKSSKDNRNGGTRYLAMQTLGMLRVGDAESTGVLADNLLFWPSAPSLVSGNGAFEDQHYFVCAQSLLWIGEPAIEPMLAKIRSSDVLPERKMAAWVIMNIEGYGEAIYRLKRTAAAEKDQPAKSRLEEATNYLVNYKMFQASVTDFLPKR